MRYLFAITLSVIAMAGLLPAQDAGETQRPTPPYLAPMPRNLHWVVAFTYPPKTPDGPAVPPPGPTYPVKIETIKVGDLRHISVAFVNGTSRQFDISGSNCFTQTPEGLECFGLGENYQPYMFYDPGFLFTQGVNLASFTEATTYQGTPVFHYKKDALEAWISVSTMLPVGADMTGLVKTSYQYLPTPNSGDVVLTAAEQNILERRKQSADVFKNMR